MIPILMTVRFGRHREYWVPVPLLLIWLLLLPFCLLALPFFVAGCRALRVPAGRALATGFGLLRGLGGTRLDIDVPDVRMAIRFI
jgi:hypothetical protein